MTACRASGRHVWDWMNECRDKARATWLSLGHLWLSVGYASAAVRAGGLAMMCQRWLLALLEIWICECERQDEERERIEKAAAKDATLLRILCLVHGAHCAGLPVRASDVSKEACSRGEADARSGHERVTLPRDAVELADDFVDAVACLTFTGKRFTGNDIHERAEMIMRGALSQYEQTGGVTLCDDMKPANDALEEFFQSIETWRLHQQHERVLPSPSLIEWCVQALRAGMHAWWHEHQRTLRMYRDAG